MKRFLLFAGPDEGWRDKYGDWHGGGGWHHFRGDFDTFDEARVAGEAVARADGMIDFTHVVDTVTREIVDV